MKDRAVWRIFRRDVLRWCAVAGLLPASGWLSKPATAAPALRPFIDEMVDHVRSFAPAVTGRLEEATLRAILTRTQSRARTYGFDFRGPVRTFIEMTLLFGSSFDTDPQYSWAGDILRAPGEQMARAEKLYRGILNYQSKVSVQAELEAVRRWQRGLRIPSSLTREGFVAETCAEVTRVFPEKATLVGRAGLTKLVDEAYAEALSSGLTTADGKVLMVAVFVALGHGALRDPYHPSIGAAVHGEENASAPERAARLKRAVTALIERGIREAARLF